MMEFSKSCETWRRLEQFRLPLILCLLVPGWMLKPSLGDPVTTLSQTEVRTLRVGQERMRERLPFSEGGKCVYELLDLKEAHWYEVKISYPASTPASFSINLLSEGTQDSLSMGRRLLNTEKIIFRVDTVSNSQKGTDMPSTKRKVLVSVKPDGFIANPHLQEQAFILFNIACEGVVLGIPVQAFWVGFLGLLVILASVLASRLVTSRLHPESKSDKHAL